MKKSKSDIIKLFRKIHGDIYDYSLIDYQKYDKKLKIICKKHGLFEQLYGDHIRGKKCKKCSKNILSQDEFIDLCAKKHKNKYNYSLVDYKNRNTKISIICPKHGLFEQFAGNHLKGCGCYDCSPSKIMTTDSFIKKSKEIHGDIYDYSKTIYDKKNKVEIICPKHGSFFQTPNNHLRNHKCVKCTTEKRVQNDRKNNNNNFLKSAHEIFGDLYDYSLVDYKNTKTKIKIICPKHGIFDQIPSNHLKGHGCYKCSNNSSKIEKDWISSFNNDNIKIHQTIILKDETKIKPDGYNPITNTIYEFWGDFWHGNPDIYNPDIINPKTKTTFGDLYEQTNNKITLIKQSGYNLIQMWENDFIKSHGS